MLNQPPVLWNLRVHHELYNWDNGAYFSFLLRVMPDRGWNFLFRNRHIVQWLLSMGHQTELEKWNSLLNLEWVPCCSLGQNTLHHKKAFLFTFNKHFTVLFAKDAFHKQWNFHFHINKFLFSHKQWNVHFHEQWFLLVQPHFLLFPRLLPAYQAISVKCHDQWKKI